MHYFVIPRLALPCHSEACRRIFLFQILRFAQDDSGGVRGDITLSFRGLHYFVILRLAEESFFFTCRAAFYLIKYKTRGTLKAFRAMIFIRKTEILFEYFIIFTMNYSTYFFAFAAGFFAAGFLASVFAAGFFAVAFFAAGFASAVFTSAGALAFLNFIAACAAARRAMGTR